MTESESMATVPAPAPDAKEPAAPIVTFKKRRGKADSNLRKRRPATPPPASDSDRESSSSEDETGQRIKRRKKSAGVTATSLKAENGITDPDLFASVAAADRNKSLSASNDATKENLLEVDADVRKGRKIGAGEAGTSDGTYRGLANQTKFFQTNPNAPSRTVGPVKAPTNVRTVTVIDYAADTCKDYKQTGFCGFGDNWYVSFSPPSSHLSLETGQRRLTLL